MPGIRRTNANQAQTRDPFEALMKVDANRVKRSFRSEQDQLAREAKRGMFDEEIAMKGSQFDRTLAERQAQNAISNANAAARLGLSREGLALRRKALNAESAAKMTPAQKELFRRENSLWDKDFLNKYQPTSKNSGKGGSGFDMGDVIKFTEGKDYSQGEVNDIMATFEAGSRAGLKGDALKNQVLQGHEADDWTTWGDNYTKPNQLIY